MRWGFESSRSTRTGGNSQEEQIRKQVLRSAAKAQLAGDKEGAAELVRLGAENIRLQRIYDAKLKAAMPAAREKVKRDFLASGHSLAEWREIDRLMGQD